MSTYGELEGLDETEGLINGATDWEIIHRNLTVCFVSKKATITQRRRCEPSDYMRIYLPKDTLRIDDE